MITIREGNAADCAAVLALLLDAFGAYRGRLDPQPSVYKETVETLQTRLKTQTLLVAETEIKNDSEMVGCLFYFPQGETIYLGRLATHADYRGQGIAAKLIQLVEEAADAAGYESVMLEVRIPLHDNVALFQKCGYEITSSQAHDGYATPTYFVMEKSITTRCFK